MYIVFQRGTDIEVLFEEEHLGTLECRDWQTTNGSVMMASGPETGLIEAKCRMGSSVII